MQRTTHVLPIVLGLVLTVTSAGAQVTTNSTLRRVSLDECIRMALEHNLSLRIERINPRLAHLTLDGSYGYYDPSFNFRGGQNFTASPGGFNNSIGLTTPPNETWVEQFSTGLGGNLPSGMRYDLSASTYRTSGRFPSYDTNLNAFIFIDRPFQYNSDVGITFTQPLLKNFWTDSARTQIKVNKKQLKISELALEYQVMTIVRSVEWAYYDLITARENVLALRLALELADRLVVENRRKVEIGTLAPLDEKQAEAQAAEAQANLIQATNSVLLAQNNLKRLFTDRFQQWHNVRLEPTDSLSDSPVLFNLGESWTAALNMRPDYNQFKQQLEQRNIVLKYNYNQLFPELNIFGSYGRSGLSGSFGDSWSRIGDDESPRWGGGGVLTFPLSRKTERSNYKASKEQVEQAILQLKQKEQDIIVEIDDAVKTAQSNLQRVQATRQARIYAEMALDAEKKKLDNGKSTSFIVLRLQRDLTSAKVSEISALADYNKALTDLHFKEGTILQRNKINLDVK